MQANSGQTRSQLAPRRPKLVRLQGNLEICRRRPGFCRRQTRLHRVRRSRVEAGPHSVGLAQIRHTAASPMEVGPLTARLRPNLARCRRNPAQSRVWASSTKLNIAPKFAEVGWVRPRVGPLQARLCFRRSTKAGLGSAQVGPGSTEFGTPRLRSNLGVDTSSLGLASTKFRTCRDQVWAGSTDLLRPSVVRPKLRLAATKSGSGFDSTDCGLVRTLGVLRPNCGESEAPSRISERLRKRTGSQADAGVCVCVPRRAFRPPEGRTAPATWTC